MKINYLEEVSGIISKMFKSVNLGIKTDLFLDLHINIQQCSCLLYEIQKKYEINLQNNFIIGETCTVAELVDKIMQLHKEKNSDNQLEFISNYALHNVPYYKKQFSKDDLKLSLIIDKESFRNELEHLSKDYLISYLNGNLIIKRIITLTGICFNSIWSKYDIALAEKEIWKLRTKWYHITIYDKCLSFHSSVYFNNRLASSENIIEYDTQKRISINKRCISNIRLNDYYKLIKDFKPMWISGEESLLYIISDYILFNKLSPFDSVKYIELGIEMSIKDIGKIEEAFPDAVIAKVYQLEEIGMIAIECPDKNMHVIEGNVNVERHDCNVAENDFDGGNIIVTNLKNKAMPFINYDTECIGSLINKSCNCGSHLPIVEINLGVENMFLNLPNGEVLSYKTLQYPIDCVNNEFNNPIIQFQMVQKDLHTIFLYLHVSTKFKGWENELEERFIKYANDYFISDIKWKIIFVEEMERCEYTGILSYFKSEL